MKEDKKRCVRSRTKCKICKERTPQSDFVWVTKICGDCFQKFLAKQAGIPWEEYGKRTVKDAVAELPEALAKPIIQAFEATGVMDVYGGNLKLYLAAIAQTLEDQSKKIDRFREIIDGISTAAKSGW
jgi:hypothetical protein